MSSPPPSSERDDRSPLRPGGGPSSSRPALHGIRSSPSVRRTRSRRAVSASAGGTIGTGRDRSPNRTTATTAPRADRTATTGDGGGHVDENRPSGSSTATGGRMRASAVAKEVAKGPRLSASPAASSAIPGDGANCRNGASASARAAGSVPEVFPPHYRSTQSSKSRKLPHMRSHPRTSREKAVAAASAAKVAGRDGHNPLSKSRPRLEVVSPRAPPRMGTHVTDKAELRPEEVGVQGPPLQNPSTFRDGPSLPPRIATTSVGGQLVPSADASVDRQSQQQGSAGHDGELDRHHGSSSSSAVPPVRSVRERRNCTDSTFRTVRAWAVPVSEEEDEIPAVVATTLSVETEVAEGPSPSPGRRSRLYDASAVDGAIRRGSPASARAPAAPAPAPEVFPPRDRLPPSLVLNDKKPRGEGKPPQSGYHPRVSPSLVVNDKKPRGEGKPLQSRSNRRVPRAKSVTGDDAANEVIKSKPRPEVVGPGPPPQFGRGDNMTSNAAPRPEVVGVQGPPHNPWEFLRVPSQAPRFARDRPSAADAAKVAGGDGDEPSKPKPRPEVVGPRAPLQKGRGNMTSNAAPRPEVVGVQGPPHNPWEFLRFPSQAPRFARDRPSAAGAAKVAGGDGNEPSKPKPRPEVVGPRALSQTVMNVVSKAEPRPEVVDPRAPLQKGGNVTNKAEPRPEVVGVRGPPPRFLTIGRRDLTSLVDASADRRQDQQRSISHDGEPGQRHGSSSSPSSAAPPVPSVRRSLLPSGRARTDNNNAHEAVRAWAVPVGEGEDETPFAVATRADDICVALVRNRRVQVVICLVAAVVVALAVGVGLLLSGRLIVDGGGSSGRIVSDGPQQPQVTEDPILQRLPPTPPTLPPTAQPFMLDPSTAMLCLATTLYGPESIGFGYAVGISRSVVAVGAPLSDDNGEDSGSVSVYFNTSSGWTFQQKILPGDGADGDQFGSSVAVDDYVIAVGARYKDNNRGAVYIFIWDGSAWKERQKLVPQDSFEGDYFGWSVALDKDQIIVGAPQGAWGDRGRGKAYIFALKGQTWEEEANLHPGDGASDDASFGRSVALRDGTALVGAPFDDTDKGTDSGSVFIFEYDASTDASSSSPWKEAVKILPEDGSVGDKAFSKAFGSSIDLVEDGSKALIGADWDDSQGTNSGSAYVLVRVGSTWTEERKLLPKDGAAYDYFGRSAVLLSKSVAVVGAYRDDDNGSNSGSVYLFIMEEDGGWTQKDKIVPADGEAGDRFGWSLAVDEGIVVVGTFDANKVYTYELC